MATIKKVNFYFTFNFEMDKLHEPCELIAEFLDTAPSLTEFIMYSDVKVLIEYADEAKKGLIKVVKNKDESTIICSRPTIKTIEQKIEMENY